MIATERAQVLLGMTPAVDGFEVYRVGRIFTVDLWGILQSCIVCRFPLRKGDRARDIYTRQVGTMWTSKQTHLVHEVCWLKSDTETGRDEARRLMAQREDQLQAVRP